MFADMLAALRDAALQAGGKTVTFCAVLTSPVRGY